ncbi:MAG: AhpC/TSA family protein [Synechococcaceae cyanobacterium]
MRAPDPLLQHLATAPGMEAGRRRLVLLLPQLGDFDSVEYAQALVPALPRLEAAGIALLAIAIGDGAGADRFCAYTGFPRERLQADATPALHRALGLYEGLAVPGGPWASLLLMCAGIGSPGTLAEVLRGYTGDRAAPPRLATPLFDLVGKGFQRPFELATVRLANMREVLGAWGTYVPDARWITQRGDTFLLESDDTVLYHHKDPGILGFSETMADPLRFLSPWLEA